MMISDLNDESLAAGRQGLRCKGRW